MNIGNVQLKNDLILAPMANYTDAGMRYLASVYGVGLTVTEMVSAKGLCFNNPNTAALLETRERGNCPVAVQLFGADPEYIKKAVEHPLLKDFDIVDINMGCPVAKVVKNGEGSALLRNPDLVYKVVKAAVSATNRPVTVKIRAGFEKDEITAPEDVEAVSLCAHCGTAVLASAHAADVDDLCRRPLYRALLELHVFERAVVITREEGKRRYRMEKMEGNLCSS